jgi:hypothetical protein
MKKCDECTPQINCIKFRQDIHATDYSYKTALAYFFYPFLYLAGPTTTYNAWYSQMNSPQ